MLFSLMVKFTVVRIAPGSTSARPDCSLVGGKRTANVSARSGTPSSTTKIVKVAKEIPSGSVTLPRVGITSCALALPKTTSKSTETEPYDRPYRIALNVRFVPSSTTNDRPDPVPARWRIIWPYGKPFCGTIIVLPARVPSRRPPPVTLTSKISKCSANSTWSSAITSIEMTPCVWPSANNTVPPRLLKSALADPIGHVWHSGTVVKSHDRQSETTQLTFTSPR
mmetsp:Transcript_22483/g.67649  ORF Transcript_22483/g.67649 Transcript_22483/m.67649 type:complete len:224 (+) Transcript_22483:13550-14221(+)